MPEEMKMSRKQKRSLVVSMDVKKFFGRYVLAPHELSHLLDEVYKIGRLEEKIEQNKTEVDKLKEICNVLSAPITKCEFRPDPYAPPRCF